MSPEQMSGAHVDGRADIFSGCYFLSIANMAYIISNEKYRPVRDACPDLSASAMRIINKALQKKVENRYVSGAEVVKALKRELWDET